VPNAQCPHILNILNPAVAISNTSNHQGSPSQIQDHRRQYRWDPPLPGESHSQPMVLPSYPNGLNILIRQPINYIIFQTTLGNTRYNRSRNPQIFLPMTIQETAVPGANISIPGLTSVAPPTTGFNRNNRGNATSQTLSHSIPPPGHQRPPG